MEMLLSMLTGFTSPINTLLVPSNSFSWTRQLTSTPPTKQLSVHYPCILTISSHIIHLPASYPAPSHHLYVAFYFVLVVTFSTNTSISPYILSRPFYCDIFSSYSCVPHLTTHIIRTTTFPTTLRPRHNPNPGAFLLHMRFSAHAIRIKTQSSILHPLPSI